MKSYVNNLRFILNLKNHFLGILALLLIPLLAQGQIFQKETSYPLPGHWFGNTIAQSSDNSYTVVSRSNSDPLGYWTPYVTKFDATGNLLQAHHLPTGQFQSGISAYPRSMVLSNAGGNQEFAVFTGLANGEGHLYRLNMTTGALDGQHFSASLGGDFILPNYIIDTGDGFAITGGIRVNNTEETFFIKTDYQGNIFLGRRYRNGPIGWRGQSIQTTSDGGYIIACDPGYGATRNDFCLLKINVSGAVVWSRRYNFDPGAGSLEHSFSVRELPNGDFIVGGDFLSAPAGPALMRVSSSGTTLWVRSYFDNANPFNNPHFTEMQINANGNVVMTGVCDDGAILLEVTTNGTPVWGRIYPGSPFWDEIDLEYTNDGGYMMVYHDNANFSGPRLIKTNSLGYSGCEDIPLNLQFETYNVPGGNRVLATNSDFLSLDVNPPIQDIEPEVEDLCCSPGEVDCGNGIIAPQYQYSIGTKHEEGAFALKSLPGDQGMLVGGYQYRPATKERDMLIAELDENGGWCWSTITDFNTNEWMVDLDPSEQFCGQAYTTGFYDGRDYDFTVSRVDEYGCPIWTNVLAGSGNEQGMEVIETMSGDVVAVGYTDSYGRGGQDVLVARFTSSGVPVWTKVIGTTADETGLAIAESATGYVIVGTSEFTSSGNRDAYVVSLDFNGNIAWSRILGRANHERANGVVIDDNTDIWITGQTESPSGDIDVMLARMQSTGTLDFFFNIGNTSSNEECYAIELDHDRNQLLLAGFTDGYGANQDDGLLIRMNLNGGMDKVMRYGLFGNERLHGVFQRANGNVFIGGVTNSYRTGFNQDIYVVKADASLRSSCHEQEIFPSVRQHLLNPISHHHIDDVFDWRSGESICESPYMNTIDGCVIPFAGDGKDRSQTEETVASKGLLKAFPNPAQDHLTIEYEVGIEATEVLILDVYGRVVLQQNLEDKNGSRTLELRDLSNGSYFLKLNLKDGDFLTERILIHHP